MSPQTQKQKLALAVIDFLRTSTADGTVSKDDSESIEVAVTCVADAFKIDADDEDAMKSALGGKSLEAIYGVFAKMQAGGKAEREPTEEERSQADELKRKGNAAMGGSNFEEAIEHYTKAIELVSTNVIFYSNRAAAYSALKKHKEAALDARKATELDPKYAKAWSRLGLALYALGDAEGSMKAYEAGIKAENNGGSDAMKSGLKMAQKKLEEMNLAKVEPESDRSGSPAAGGMPDLSGLESMMGGGGGGISEMMKNPMLQQMAQNLLGDPSMMSNLLNNPKLKELANSLGGQGGSSPGGGMPDLSSLMSDPSLAEMAKNFMGKQK